jgi:hypothetical protein
MKKSLVIIYLVFWTLLIAGCASTVKDLNDKTLDTNTPVIIKHSGGASMLIKECSEKSFIEEESDYIIEGQVKKKDVHWNDDKTSIVTYVEFSVDKYLKGEPFGNNLVSIEVLGGCVDDFCEGAEDQPGVFQEGENLRMYLEKSDYGFVFTCGLFGVSGADDSPRIINVG